MVSELPFCNRSLLSLALTASILMPAAPPVFREALRLGRVTQRHNGLFPVHHVIQHVAPIQHLTAVAGQRHPADGAVTGSR